MFVEGLLTWHHEKKGKNPICCYALNILCIKYLHTDITIKTNQLSNCKKVAEYKFNIFNNWNFQEILSIPMLSELYTLWLCCSTIGVQGTMHACMIMVLNLKQ